MIGGSVGVGVDRNKRVRRVMPPLKGKDLSITDGWEQKGKACYAPFKRKGPLKDVHHR